MDGNNHSEPRRIVILGKTGSGKSSLANTIFGETLFKVNHSSKSGTRECRAETRSVNGRSITLIDTSGFFDTDISEQDLKPEIIKCVTECAPGPHAFLILLKVEKYTQHEQTVITKMKENFSEEAFRRASVVFTHGDQLEEGQNIGDFVHKDENLRELVKKCGGRCHVIDNKYWKEKPRGQYRSNKFQVEQLLKTINKMIEDNNDGYYSNTMLQTVEEEIQQEMKIIIKSPGTVPDKEVRTQAKGSVWKKLPTVLTGVTVGALVGAFLDVTMTVSVVFRGNTPTASSCTALVASAAVGAVIGGIAGFVAASDAETPLEAAKLGAMAACHEVTDAVAKLSGLGMKKAKGKLLQYS